MFSCTIGYHWGYRIENTINQVRFGGIGLYETHEPSADGMYTASTLSSEYFLPSISSIALTE